MNDLTASHRQRLTSLFGLLAIVAVAGAIALNQSATADCSGAAPKSTGTKPSVLLQDPATCLKNPAQSPFTGKTYDTLVVKKDASGNPTTGMNGFLKDFNAILLGFAGAFAILAFFAGAYTYFLSGGSEENMTKGRHQMLGSILAFALIVSATAIVGIFEKLFSTGKP